jgi:ABC-type antimicrobial peptide transport system permease subunit
MVGGVGIMNIMLANAHARIREIGIRKAMGATRCDIHLQFLAEAVIIALVGGGIGTLVGIAMPLSVRYFTDYSVPISGCAQSPSATNLKGIMLHGEVVHASEFGRALFVADATGDGLESGGYSLWAQAVAVNGTARDETQRLAA